MVAFTHFVAAAVALCGALPGVFADADADATLTKAEDLPDAIAYTTPAKRGLGARTNQGQRVDPYAGYQCAPWYGTTGLPSNPPLHENNCWRGFLNARTGSNGFHCPSTAFNYCCQWYSLTEPQKVSVTRYGTLYRFLPWTSFCGAAGPFNTNAEVLAVVQQVNNVCAATLNHQVAVTLPDAYAALNPNPLSHPVCRQNY